MLFSLSSRPHRSLDRAFTLLELMVVVVVIMILVAIAVPVFSAVQERGRSTACAGNLRQIGAALLAFAAEHDGEFPTAGSTIVHGTTDPTTGKPGWTEQLEPYLGTSAAIFVCPSSSRVLPANKKYSYYLGCHAAYAQVHAFAAVRQILIQNPSTYILAGDNTHGFSPDDCDKDDYTQEAGFSVVPAPFHNGHINLVYADGHGDSAARPDPTRMSNLYDGTWQNQ